MSEKTECNLIKCYIPPKPQQQVDVPALPVLAMVRWMYNSRRLKPLVVLVVKGQTQSSYSACFLGAMGFVAGQQKIKLPAATTVNGQVGIGPCAGGFAITVALEVHIPEMALADAEALVAKAHQVCPYSNATRGNVDVQLSVI